MKTIDKSLEEAYQSTRYEFTANGHNASIKIGGVNKELENLCKEHAVASWAFITAYNPFSRPLSDVDNVHRQRLLESLLITGDFNIFKGKGVGVSDDWPSEPSFLVLGIDQEKALAYGRVFDQNAIVFGHCGSAAQLLFCVSC